MTDKPWEYPDCPECGRHLYVGRCKARADYICQRCDRRFDESELMAYV